MWRLLREFRRRAEESKSALEPFQRTSDSREPRPMLHADIGLRHPQNRIERVEWAALWEQTPTLLRLHYEWCVFTEPPVMTEGDL